MPVPMVTIRKAEYDDLLEDAKFLTALYDMGVDNWDGYAEAQQMMTTAQENDSL